MTVYVAGTCDTKGAELSYVRDLVVATGVTAQLVDLSTSGRGALADVGAEEVARHHPAGAGAVFTGDRGSAVAAMARAFAEWLPAQKVSGVIGLGGSGGTSLITPAMQALPIGVPKVMVSTVASGNVAPYVGPADICMMYSVTDVAGLNRISRRILANAAHGAAGMVLHTPVQAAEDKPALGLTMFGVTTTCVEAVVDLMEARYDCLVFHATGTGGRSMEKLLDSGLVEGVIDVTTTEICDLLMGGVFPATEDRLGAIARTRLPYVGSVGALDMVNFGAPPTIPERYAGRTFYEHNPTVTLMRTTPDENARMGAWLAEKLNVCEGPVRLLLPEGGVSALDASGQPFEDEAARAALFDAIEATLVRTDDRQLIRLPHHINDGAFADALTAAYADISNRGR